MQELKLIDGTFTADEARNVLINIFSTKIQFHQMKNYSSRERFGVDDQVALKRIDDLKRSIHQIEELIAEARNSNSNLVIRSSISLNLGVEVDK